MKITSRKLLLSNTLLLSILATNSYASSPYFGVNIGAIINDWKHTYTATAANNETVNLATEGALAGTDIGFRWNVTPSFFIDSEVFYDYAFVGNSQRNQGARFNQHRNAGYGIHIAPGFAFNRNNTAQLILGYGITRFNRTGSDAGSLGSDFKKKVRGTQLGLQSTAFVTNHVGISTTSIYSTYKKINTNSNAAGSESTSYSISGNAMTLGINYFFTRTPSPDAPEMISPFAVSDLYFGVGAGASKGTIKYEDTGATNSQLLESMPGIIVEVFGGDKIIKGPISLSMEAFAGYNTSKFKMESSGNNTSHSYKQTFQFGAAMLPGLKVNSDNVLYARLGANIGHFKWSGQLPSSNGGGTSKIKMGLQIGFGDEFALTEETSLRIQYTFNMYPKTKTSAAPQFTNNPRSDQFTFALSFYL